MGTIRVGLAGIGNCASALVQGLTHYAARPSAGLAREAIGGYRISEIVLAAAFDVNAEKVGLDLADAIWAPPNVADRFSAVLPTGVTALRGPTLDGLGPSLRGVVREAQSPPVDVAAALRAARIDVLVSYLPVGADAATQAYAEAALAAGCAFVNCIPSFIASDAVWASRFAQARLPLIGDGVKSQLGATILHRALAQLFADRGVPLRRTSQLNVGGNTDFLNMLDRDRLASKKLSKTSAVRSLAPELTAANVHVGPSDHVPWLGDRKWAHLRLEGEGFGGLPIAIEAKLEVHDSPNSAGVVVDAIRCAKLARDRGLGGALVGPSACFMKSPPEPMGDACAYAALERFLEET